MRDRELDMEEEEGMLCETMVLLTHANVVVLPVAGEKPYTCQWPDCNCQFARYGTAN
jgi:hypothetical protein